ncbi:hypothetical protein Vafri_18533, partial [Volvox africanus]
WGNDVMGGVGERRCTDTIDIGIDRVGSGTVPSPAALAVGMSSASTFRAASACGKAEEGFDCAVDGGDVHKEARGGSGGTVSGAQAPVRPTLKSPKADKSSMPV